MKQTRHSWSLTAVSLLLIVCLFTSCGTPKEGVFSSQPASSVAASSAPEVSSQPEVSEPQESTPPQSQPQSSQEQSQVTSQSDSSHPDKVRVDGTGYIDPSYKTNFDIEDNVFMDALLYTGYNMEKHRADGNMWVYILSADKRGLGYLSDITYGGGSSGLETNEQGLPDIAHFEQGGLVCASFATYVYFNYLPNAAGIDTSMLTLPERTYNAHSFYTAAKDWIAKGYTRSIGFTASRTSSGYIDFQEDEEIPIGSIIVFEDDRKRDGRGSHITVYAGYKNGHHWVFQVGTSNGPEMCAVERMLFGPDPQWPLMVIETPSILFQPKSEQPTQE
ncbi:MAG: hypothetical protein IKT68_04435 [Clostridia bacterium]|nr:hypothetical protein [Clostridia bacterium]